MKKIIYYIIILIIFTGCISRKHISSSQDSNIKSVIENKQLNVLYRGIENYLTIHVPNSDSIQVSGTGVKKKNENNYSVTPSVGISMEITVTGFFKGKKSIDKREFRILHLDKPFTSIGNRIEQITLSKEKLADSRIKFFIPQLVINLPNVEKFQYQINNEKPAINYGEEFNESAKEKIFKMKSGDYMIIDELSFNTEFQNSCLKEVTKLTVYIK
ncbi:GldM family protein [Chryseobacterium camelliae]|uniref:GldM family protein n=1 Tax=Chryseobacterium camelliae TaxID=1265445 RepID=A0ABY7QJY4_9FLAO|nr:GldM family protein [Chryseobacterium camelliae]WBV59444.1 GldM family protein [Chryseobacterium camelliae]